jgi:hypothetical protein
MTLSPMQVRMDPRRSKACTACTMGDKDCELVAEVLGHKGECLVDKDGELDRLLMQASRRK